MSNKKRLIYLEIMRAVVPYARSIQAKSVWKRACVDLYPEFELVHNIYALLKYENFEKYDVFWVNTQGKNFAEACKVNMRPVGYTVLPLIAEIVNLIPDDLKLLLDVDSSFFEVN